MKGFGSMSYTSDSDKTTYTRLAFLMIAVGVLLGVDSVMGFSVMHKLWPLLITLLGTGLIGFFFKRKKRGGIYLAIGEYLVLFSGLAVFCNFTSWDIMLHLWPLFILFLGVVFLTVFAVRPEEKYLLLFGLLLLSISICLLFVFSVNVRYWWTIFILTGASLLVWAYSR